MTAASNPNILGDLMAGDNAHDVTVRLKAGALTFRVVDGEAVLLDIERSEYLGLNSSATALLESIKHGATVPELVAVLLERFDVTPEVAANDVELFLEACAEKGWLER
jgi:hypothetical protein